MVDFDSHRDAAGGTSRGGPDEHSLPEGINFGDVPSISCYPEVILDAEAIVGFGLIGSFMPDDGGEQNIRGPNMEWRDRGSITLVLKNPEVVTGNLFKKTDTDADQSATYKLTNLDSHDVGEKAQKTDDGFEVVGVEYGNASFEPAEEVEGVTETAGEVMETEDLAAHPMLEADDRIVQFYFDKGRGQRVAKILDRVGGTNGYYLTNDQGEKVQTKGIIEYHPAHGTDAHEWGKDPYPRVAGTPNIRSDAYDEPIRIVRMFREDPVEADGFPAQTINVVAIDEVGQEVDLETAFSDDDDRDFRATEEDREYLPVELDTDTFPLEFPVGEPAYNRVYAWHDGQVSDTEGQSVEDETRDMEFSDESDESASGAVTYQELDEEWQDFVDEAIDENVLPSTTEDFDAVVKSAVEDDGLSVTDPQTIATVVEERA